MFSEGKSTDLIMRGDTPSYKLKTICASTKGVVFELFWSKSSLCFAPFSETGYRFLLFDLKKGNIFLEFRCGLAGV